MHMGHYIVYTASGKRLWSKIQTVNLRKHQYTTFSFENGYISKMIYCTFSLKKTDMFPSFQFVVETFPVDLLSYVIFIQTCYYFTDARYVREELRIVGTLVGCLPRAPRQNVHLGLPLQLMPEETTLLLEKGITKYTKSFLVCLQN